MRSERPPRHATLIGHRLGHHEVRELLGRGGMGDVYRAFDTRLRREVALKVLPSDLASDPARQERFRREATAVAALSHPNVVVIHSVEEVDGSLFLTMELVSGRSLRAHLGERRLPIDATLALALQVAEGLAAAHAAGVIHRDLKPENVMVSDTGLAKILDFGLAKLRATLPTDPGVSTLAEMTGPGIAMGTAQYMSPEQALGRDVDERTDVFAFGALLFEMVTGESAFLGATGAATLDRILHRSPPPVASLNPEAPSALDALLARALAKDRDHRYRAMRELVSDLKAVLEGSPVGRPVQALLAPESIAVLPFTDMSPRARPGVLLRGSRGGADQPPRSRAPRSAWSPALRLSPSRARDSTSRRSAAGSWSTRCSKAASERLAASCGSPSSSSAPARGTACSRSATTASSRTSSRSRTRSPSCSSRSSRPGSACRRHRSRHAPAGTSSRTTTICAASTR